MIAFLRASLCLWIFHRLTVVQELSPYSRKCHCSRCGMYFAMNDEVRAFLPWDEEFERMHCAHLGISRTNQ